MSGLKEEQTKSEYRLTYEGKTIATLNADREISPGEALSEIVQALVGFAFGGDADE